MGKVNELLENKSISRRSFLKGTAALGAMAAVYGCSREEDPIYSAGDRTYADDEYFTKEDGMEAANEVAYQLEKEFPEAKLEVIDMQLDNHSFYVVLTDKDGNEFTEEITLDMRKIRHPLDLIKKYAPALTERFIKQIKDFYSEM